MGGIPMIVRILAIALSLAAAAPASAATIVLNLTGTVSSGFAQSVISGGNKFDFFTIVLSGYTPTLLSVGDEVQATITLDGPLTAPGATIRNGMDFFMGDTTGAAGPTAVSGTTDLSLMGVPVISASSGASSFAFLFNGYTNFTGTAFTFDTIQSNFTITSIDAGSILPDFIGLRTIAVNPYTAAVPEPATWALMIAGFAAIGGALRSRRRRQLTTITATA